MWGICRHSSCLVGAQNDDWWDSTSRNWRSACDRRMNMTRVHAGTSNENVSFAVLSCVSIMETWHCEIAKSRRPWFDSWETVSVRKNASDNLLKLSAGKTGHLCVAHKANRDIFILQNVTSNALFESKPAAQVLLNDVFIIRPKYIANKTLRTGGGWQQYTAC